MIIFCCFFTLALTIVNLFTWSANWMQNLSIISNVTQSSLDLTLQKDFAVADALGKAHVVRESTSKIRNATKKKKHVNREKLKH